MRRCSTPPRPRSVSARRRSLSGSGASRGFGVYHCFWGWTALARGWSGACFRRTAGAPRLSIWPSLVRASSHALASADEGLRSRYPGEVWPDVFNCSNQNRGVNLATRRCNIALGHYRCDRSRNPWRRMSGELYHDSVMETQPRGEPCLWRLTKLQASLRILVRRRRAIDVRPRRSEASSPFRCGAALADEVWSLLLGAGQPR